MLVELLPPDTARAYDAMAELRVHLQGRDRTLQCQRFVEQVDLGQRPHGYRLVAVVPDEDDGPALAVAGFREAASLSWGHHLYVDDLVTASWARRQGHATRLLAWIFDEANRLGCDEIHLDSGVGPTRHDAHRLYLQSGYVIGAHHFVRQVRPPDGRRG